jgi:adenylate cyclase
MAFRFATEERLKRRIKSSFSLYLKPEIVELISQSANPESELAAARRPLSALFVDIRGFTAMSERMPPESVVEALDVYLEELTASVQQYNGTINKYVGDEIIGIWNCLHLHPQHDHAMLAVRCGLDMIARMDRINEQLRALGLPTIKYGIGINTGEAIVGQMGSSFRKQYDVIGDVMNTAARLCSAAGGGEIIISQWTWEAIGDHLIVEETDPLKLKGKSEPMRTFAVLGIASEEPAPASAPLPAASAAD